MPPGATVSDLEAQRRLQPPGTPHRTAKLDPINAIVQDLNERWQLDLPIRDAPRSPSTTVRDRPNKVYNHIQYLYHKSISALDGVREELNRIARIGKEDNIDELLRLLDQATTLCQERSKNAGRRESLNGAPRNLEEPSNLAPKIVREPSKDAPKVTPKVTRAASVKKSPQKRQAKIREYLAISKPTVNSDGTAESSISKCITGNGAINSVQRQQQHQQPTLSPTVPNTRPSTPPALDRDDFATPPQSPTLAAQDRKQENSARKSSATSGSRRHSGPAGINGEPRPSLSASKKRPSKDFLYDDSPVPKFPCISSERQRSVSDGIFAVPPRSNYNRRNTAPFEPIVPSAGSSFNSMPRSANASFSTVADDPPIDTAQTSFSDTRQGDLDAYNNMPPPGSGTTVSEDMEFHMARFLSQEQMSRSPRPQLLDTVALSDALAAALPKAPANKLITRPNEQKLDMVIDPVVEPLSESMEHFQVRALPKQGLFVDDVHEGLSNAPLRVRYEVCRVALANGMQPYDVMSTYKRSYDSQSALADYFKSHPLVRKMPKASSSKAWIAGGKNFENVTLKGKLSITPVNEGPLFRMTLEPLQIEQSCRFQRAFGGDRFLYIDVPSLFEADLPSHLKNQCNLKRRLREWLQIEHRFLGRTWRALMLEDRKRKKSYTQKDPDRGQRITLFATSGCDSIWNEPLSVNKPETSIGELVDWFLCIKKNSHQPFPKVYARLELGLSRTHPALIFRPSQIRRIKDVHADGTPEATCFNDQALLWEDIHDPETVMNDGCARMSVGAAFEVWKALGKPGPVPSVFQGRVAGAKGLWMISAPTYSEHPGDREIWIEISDSQNKFEPHTEDLSDELCDKNRLTFEVLTHSKQPRAAALHVSFIPILLDRGVPREQLKHLVVDYLDYERQQLMENIANPVWLRKWINEQNSLSEERNRQGDLVWRAGLPLQPVEEAILLLESGFTPTSNQFLAKSVQKLVEQYLLKLKIRLTVPLGRSSNLWGIADPCNTLEPGEVHLNFSTNFQDEKSGEVYPLLDGRDVLIARHPALRRSDIQKARAVFKPELSHLTDVIIFSAKGRFPLAAKLQGGDYDGDTFWICWEQDLVRSFKNAPAPFRSPKPENYGIEVERSKLAELTTGPDTIDSFLKRSLAFRSNASMLGRATNDHESLSYAKNTLDSPGTNALADLHDLLVDSAKNGYVFDESAYRKYCHKNPHIGKITALPAFRQYIKELAGSRDVNPRKFRPNKQHIVDYLLFDIVLPHVEETLVQLKAAFGGSGTSDSDLPALYLEEKNAAAQVGTAADEVGSCSTALKALKDDLAKIRQGFNEQYGKNKRSGTTGSEGYSQNIEQCYQRYIVVEPFNPSDDPTIIRWTKPIVPGAFTYWSLIKASALYHLYDRKLDFVFGLAGKELAYLKACACGKDGVRFLVPRMWANMKPRKIKGGVTEEEQLDSEYETAAEEEMEEYGDDWTADDLP